jgi:hypothetical protein
MRSAITTDTYLMELKIFSTPKVQNRGLPKLQFDYSMKSHYLHILERNDLSSSSIIVGSS